MLNHLDLTIIIFSIVLLSLIIFPSIYWQMDNNKLVLLNRKPLWRDWRFLLPCLIYTILLGYRYDYAFDWYQYQQTFLYLQRGQLYRESTEVGYLAINWILGKLSFNYYSIFILEGFIWIFSICYLCKEERKAWIFILPLLFIMYRWRCLNLSRQFFAISIFIIAYKNLIEGRKLRYWILGLLAFSIHTSAILFVVPMYFISKFVKYPPLKYVLILYMLLFIFQNQIQDFFFRQADFISTNIITNKGDYYSYENLTDRFSWEQRSLIRRLFQGIKDLLYLMFIYKLKDSSLLTKKHKIILFIGFIGLFASVAMGENEISTRLIIYLTIFYYIGWGLIYAHLFSRKNVMPQWFKILSVIIIIHYIYSFYASICSEYAQGFYLEYKNWL